jgi:hypothetical protein
MGRRSQEEPSLRAEGEAIQFFQKPLDCFVASLLAMTGYTREERHHVAQNGRCRCAYISSQMLAESIAQSICEGAILQKFLTRTFVHFK